MWASLSVCALPHWCVSCERVLHVCWHFQQSEHMLCETAGGVGADALKASFCLFEAQQEKQIIRREGAGGLGRCASFPPLLGT